MLINNMCLGTYFQIITYQDIEIIIYSCFLETCTNFTIWHLTCQQLQIHDSDTLVLISTLFRCHSSKLKECLQHSLNVIKFLTLSCFSDNFVLYIPFSLCQQPVFFRTVMKWEISDKKEDDIIPNPSISVMEYIMMFSMAITFRHFSVLLHNDE